MTQTFTCTSSDPYDRHDYEVLLKNGKKVMFDNWEDVQIYWFTNNNIPDYLDYVIAKDKKKVKSKGFAQ